MLYILSVNQPKLTTGRQPVTSRAKGNPMKDHARHVPGSTRSRRTLLSSSFPYFLPSLLVPAPAAKCSHYATKMLPNFKTQILIYSASTTYNFDPRNWSHFLGRGLSPLPRGEGRGEGQTGFGLFCCSRPSRLMVDCYSFSLGEKVRMRNKLGTVCPPSYAATNLPTTIQNRQNRRTRRFSTDSTTLYQPLTHTKIGVRRFSAGAPDWRSIPVNSWSISISGKNRNFPESAEPLLVRSLFDN